MDPVTLSLLLSAGTAAGTAAVKGGIGIAQAAKGAKLAKSAKRPTATIPQSAQDYLKNATARAQENKLPGQQLMEEELAASTASGITSAQQGASSSAGLMAAIGGLKGIEQEKVGDLNIAGAEMQDRNKQALQEALLRYSGEEKEVFDINKMQPFKDTAAAAEGVKGAALQNVVGAVEGLAGAAAMGAGSKTPPIVDGKKLTSEELTLYEEAKAAGYKKDITSFFREQKGLRPLSVASF